MTVLWRVSKTGENNDRMDLTFFFGIVTFLINFQHISSTCMGYDTTVTVYPEGDINIIYPGQPLELYCTVEKNFTSKDIAFRLNGIILDEFVIVNETTIKLYIEQPVRQRSLFYCTNLAVNKHCPSRVLVDGLPTNVEDFKCISKNLMSLKCSWKYTEPYAPIEYNLTFFSNQSPVTNCNVTIEAITKRRYCEWNEYTFPRYRQQYKYYDFNLISSNIFGTMEQNITVDHYSIVKPGIPVNLTVSNIEQHSVTLGWKLPLNIETFFKSAIVYKIEYQFVRPVFHQIDATSLNRVKISNTFRITLPYAHKRYEVRIAYKPVMAKDEYWSDYAYTFFDTESKIPDRPPDMAPGAFGKAVFNNSRELIVYWKQLEEYEENGSNFTYKVKVAQDGKVHTLYPKRNMSLSFVTINKASMNSLQIQVQSKNALGLSKNSSYIYIPAETQMLDGPNYFTTLALENGTYELSWKPMDSKIDNYTLFWCLYNYTKMCIGVMNFTTLESTKTRHYIDLPSEKKYQFAMSVNNGSQSSGMIWAVCDLSRHSEVMYAFPAELKHDEVGKTYIKLSWSMGCTLRDGVVTGYNITFCPVIRNTQLCDHKFDNQSVYIDNPMDKATNVTNLLPSRTYRFGLALNTIYGLKVAKANAYATTLHSAPTNPTNVTINHIKNDSLVISWDPPLERNGNIVRYLIYYGNITAIDAVANPTDISRRQLTLANLDGFTNYTVSIVACNSPDMSLCSPRNASEEVFVRTRIGPPSKLNPPNIELTNILTWVEPVKSAGYVNLYQVKRIGDNNVEKIYNSTQLSMSIQLCEGDSAVSTFQVRAVNIDDLPHHGAYASTPNVMLPQLGKDEGPTMLAGEWSEKSSYGCKNTNVIVMNLVFIGLFVLAIGMALGSIKLYKKYRKMEDLQAVLPNGLCEKDIKKFTNGWTNPSDSGKVSSSDEAFLLPNKTATQSPTIQQEVTGASDRTDSTTLSQTSLEHEQQEASIADDGSTSSLNLDIEPSKTADDQENNESECETESSHHSSNTYGPSFKNSPNGYIQAVAVPSKGYVQPSTMPQGTKNEAPNIQCQPTTSSYVMAGLSPAPIFTTGVAAPRTEQIPMSGYVQAEQVQPRHSSMNFPTIGPSPTKGVGPGQLLSLPILPQSKCGPDGSYIQLQSMEPLSSSLKPAVRDNVPSKPPTSNGYVSAADVVMNKHLNILSGGHLEDDLAILDPAMSPDAYCRFSWSADPSNDNLRAILTDSHTALSSKEY